MNRNRTFAALITFVAVIALALGTFFAIGSSSTDGALAPGAGTEQQLTVKARDTAEAPLRGVEVRLVDSTNSDVATGTTTASGEVVLSFSPKAGSYAVIATEPTGYRARDDKDGGSSHQGNPTCDNVFLCIHLAATEAPDGSVTVTIPDVTVDQQQALDDLWFELTPPIADVEQDAAIALEDDVLVDDVLVGDVPPLAGDDDLLVDPRPEVPGIDRLCVEVRHQPVPDQAAASGIWVRGEVYGLDGGWIWVQGPTLNDGDPIQLPVTDGSFEGPLGINSYGDHTFERFDLVSTPDGVDPIDLLPTLEGGPGTQVTVTGAEGPAFDSECFDLDPAVTDDVIAEPTPTPETPAGPVSDADELLEDFLDGFLADHDEGDIDGLLDTLHPAIPLAFGETECDAYVTRTAGSLIGAEVRSVGQLTDVDLDTPAGPITITDVIPFEVEFTLVDGSTMTSEANLAVLDGEARWLTRCGR